MHAIIGSGRAAINHVDAFNFNKRKIKYCCDIDENKLNCFAEKYNINYKTIDYIDILKDPDIRSVSICTDHASHAKIAIEALNNGKHVIVEKPMALSIADGRNMLNTAKNNNKILTVISQHRFDKLIIEIQKLIKNGIFGEVTLITGFLECFKDEEYYKDSSWRGILKKEGGSSLINQCIHTLDLIVSIMGVPIEVQTQKTNLKFKGIIETEDTLVSTMKFNNGALGTISTTNTSVETWRSEINVVGTKGSISFSTGFPIKISNFILDSEETKKIRKYLSDIENEKEVLPPTASYYGISHRYQIKNFLETIESSANLVVNPEESLKTLETILKIYNY